MYETMVKEAYNNIVGFEKEAEALALPPAKATTIARTTARNAGTKAINAGRGYLDALEAKDLRGALSARKAYRDMLPCLERPEVAEILKDRGVDIGRVMKEGARTAAACAPIAAAAVGTGIAAKKLYDKKKARKAQEALEAADAQKTAAEQDYLEACAYEDAALEVLAELGYDVEEFCKEASEDMEDSLTAEEMDEAAFSYLAERGYFDED